MSSERRKRMKEVLNDLITSDASTSVKLAGELRNLWEDEKEHQQKKKTHDVDKLVAALLTIAAAESTLDWTRKTYGKFLSYVQGEDE